MSELLALKEGDAVVISDGVLKLQGIVRMASLNHRSLIVTFDGMIGGFLGSIPLLWTEDEGYGDVFVNQRYQLERSSIQ